MIAATTWSAISRSVGPALIPVVADKILFRTGSCPPTHGHRAVLDRNSSRMTVILRQPRDLPVRAPDIAPMTITSANNEICHWSDSGSSNWFTEMPLPLCIVVRSTVGVGRRYPTLDGLAYPFPGRRRARPPTFVVAPAVVCAPVSRLAEAPPQRQRKGQTTAARGEVQRGLSSPAAPTRIVGPTAS
jgi:hypothetical protein